jgi:transposase
MRPRNPLPDDAISESLRLMKERRRKPDYRRFQVVYLAATEARTDEEIARVTGYAVRTIRETLTRCRRDGVASLIDKPRGGRKYENMTLAEEKAVLSSFFEQAQQGGVLVVTDIHNALNAHVGKALSKATVYEILHRHNWRKIVPRRRHPKSQVEAQEEFKKNFSTRSRSRRTR